MAPERKRRRGRGEGSVEQLPDGRWRAVLSLGVVGGKRRRRKIYGKTKQEALAKLREAQSQQAKGMLADAGKLTVAAWLTRWLEMTKPKVEPNTWTPYEVHCRLHLIPRIGNVPLGRLEAMHVEGLYAAMNADGEPASKQRKVAKTLNVALREAVRKKLIPHNPASDV